jgi:glutathione S-transferase
MMKLHYWRACPYACKVLAVVKYLGLQDQIVHEPLHPWEKGTGLTALNPLGKIPVLVLEDGSALFDSQVICLYLADLATLQSKGDKGLYPQQSLEKFEALRLEALATGMMDACVAYVLEEHARPTGLQSLDWLARQRAKVEASLLHLEQNMACLSATTPTIGDISLSIALSYLNYRFASYIWHPDHPNLTRWFEQMLRITAIAESLPNEVHTLPIVMEKIQR